MPRMVVDWNANRLALGGLLVAVGTGSLAYVPELSARLGQPEAELILLPFGSLLVLFGLIVAFWGSVSFVPNASMLLDRWDGNEIMKSLRRAGSSDTIRILHTWFPDVEEFTEDLRELLTRRGKKFQLRILLMAANAPDDLQQPGILVARVRHRDIPPNIAAHHIRYTRDRVINLKKEVDEKWSRESSGQTLDLQIRTYDHLPFGPLYQIADRVIYAGFFLSHAPSSHAPMLKITRLPASANGGNDSDRVWSIFADQMNRAWEKGTIVFPIQGEQQQSRAAPD